MTLRKLFVVTMIWVTFFMFACSKSAIEHYNLGNAYVEQGKLDEAIEECAL